MTTNDSTESNI